MLTFLCQCKHLEINDDMGILCIIGCIPNRSMPYGMSEHCIILDFHYMWMS